MHDAKARGFRSRHFEATDGDVRALLDMLLQHELVVHFVDVVTGENDDIPGAITFDDIDVLINRIRGPEIPIGFGNALARGQNVETLVALGPKEVPTHLQMPNKAMGL